MNEALDEKYLQYIAQHRNIDLKEVTLLIDRCIKHLSAVHDIDYNVIYKTVFSSQGLEHIMRNSVPKPKTTVKQANCHLLSMEECIQSNDCFYLEPYGCLPRKFPDADEINQDPNKYIKKYLGKTEDLKRVLKIAAYLYSNFSGGGLSDNAYDALEWEYNNREKIKGRAFEKIGAPVVEKLRIDLEYPMPSLEKAYPGSARLINFLSISKNYNASLKLDGVSGMITYKDGRLVMINTKGQDNVGGNVTYLKDYIKMPVTVPIDYLVVRGEFILSKEIWKDKYEGTFSNARAFVSGKINSGFIVSALNDIEFIAYEIMVHGHDKMVPSTSHAFKILNNYQFKTVDHVNLISPTIFEIMTLYKEKRESSNYYIDGLVLKIDEAQMAVKKVTDKQSIEPLYAIAFKMQLEEQKRATKAIDVEWKISRYGRYLPVVIYEAVYIDGNRLTRATGHNAAHITDWNMGVGTNITIIRGGEVIPQIIDVIVDPGVIPIFPPTTYEWHWDKSDIIVNDIENNPEVHKKRILHFFETIELARLGPKMVEKLYDAGYKTAESIIRASINDFVKIKGIGLKTATGYYDNIRFIMANTPPDRFIESSMTFSSGIGRTLLKQLFKVFPHIMDYSEKEIRVQFAKTKVPGFGAKRIDNVAVNIPKLREYLDSFAKEDIKKSIDNYIKKAEYLKTHYNPMIYGKTFVLTQMPFDTDYELEDYIYDNGGLFSSAVTSKTEAVICGNMGSMSKKMTAGAQLGVNVLFLQEFSERYNINLKRFEKKI